MVNIDDHVQIICKSLFDDPVYAVDDRLRELDAIEAESKSLPVPITHLAPYFELRQNIHDLRDRLREGIG